MTLAQLGQLTAAVLGTTGAGIAIKEAFKWATTRGAQKEARPLADWSLMQKGNAAAMDAVLQSLTTARQDAAEARERATHAEERADAADQRADVADQRADVAERKVASLEIRLDEAEATVRRLEQTVSSLTAPSALPGQHPRRRATDKQEG